MLNILFSLMGDLKGRYVTSGQATEQLCSSFGKKKVDLDMFFYFLNVVDLDILKRNL